MMKNEVEELDLDNPEDVEYLKMGEEIIKAVNEKHLKCTWSGCENIGFGTAYFSGIKKWYPFCEDHYNLLKRNGFPKDKLKPAKEAQRT